MQRTYGFKIESGKIKFFPIYTSNDNLGDCTPMETKMIMQAFVDAISLAKEKEEESTFDDSDISYIKDLFGDIFRQIMYLNNKIDSMIEKEAAPEEKMDCDCASSDISDNSALIIAAINKVADKIHSMHYTLSRMAIEIERGD